MTKDTWKKKIYKINWGSQTNYRIVNEYTKLC